MRRLLGSCLAFVCLLGTATAEEKIRVACIGDSITAGAGVEGGAKNFYPAVLEKLLGEKYQVRNFGVSGRTLLSKGDFPYIKEKAYQNALAYKPNIVVIKLGTNDVKPQNWKFKDQFEADYTALIKSFQQLDSKPQVFLCVPVPVFGNGNFGITDEPVRTGVKPKVESLAKELNLPVIDLYKALSDKKDMFPDKVHPNAAGAKVMAETVAKAIQNWSHPVP